ncbi:hypothetical protein HKCCE4037_08495 [Rhodobacterales bacterium HKCCE4037]|nr:hypothetical protein [Rhodobacterales bacterium HKCCE4037]
MRPIRVLFAHAAGHTPNDPPLPRLRRALGPGFQIDAPDLGAPDPAVWTSKLSAALTAPRAPSILVGHSLGGSELLRVIATHHPRFSAAGFVGLGVPLWGMPDWPYEAFMLPDGAAKALSGLDRIVFFGSADDDVVDPSHLPAWRDRLPRARTVETHGNGHIFDRGAIAPVLLELRRMAGMPK